MRNICGLTSKCGRTSSSLPTRPPHMRLLSPTGVFRTVAGIPREASTCTQSAVTARKRSPSRSSRVLTPSPMSSSAPPREHRFCSWTSPAIAECGDGLFHLPQGDANELTQRLLEIGDQVGDVLDTDRQPHQV